MEKYAWLGHLLLLVTEEKWKREIVLQLGVRATWLLKRQRSPVIGRALFEIGRIWTSDRQPYLIPKLIGKLDCAGDKYTNWSNRARRAIECWLVIGKRCHVVKVYILVIFLHHFSHLFIVGHA